jgi:hypothetical protein
MRVSNLFGIWVVENELALLLVGLFLCDAKMEMVVGKTIRFGVDGKLMPSSGTNCEIVRMKLEKKGEKENKDENGVNFDGH